jgi:hypothetical protein
LLVLSAGYPDGDEMSSGDDDFDAPAHHRPVLPDALTNRAAALTDRADLPRTVGADLTAPAGAIARQAMTAPQHAQAPSGAGIRSAREVVVRPDFATALWDGRWVVGRHRDGQWSIYVYAADDGSLLGHAIASTRLSALEQAGLSGDDVGEVLGRTGI